MSIKVYENYYCPSGYDERGDETFLEVRGSKEDDGVLVYSTTETDNLLKDVKNVHVKDINELNISLSDIVLNITNKIDKLPSELILDEEFRKELVIAIKNDIKKEIKELIRQVLHENKNQ